MLDQYVASTCCVNLSKTDFIESNPFKISLEDYMKILQLMIIYTR